MKFQITSKEFKSAVDRALTVVNSKFGGSLSCVKITAGSDSIVISGTNAIDFVDIKADAVVVENGYAYIRASDIVKVYNLPGYITVEVGNGIFSVRNDKKCCEVQTMEYMEDVLPTKPVFNFDENCRFKFAEKEILFTMENLKCFLSTDEGKRPVLAGYNISGKDSRIVACDGHRLGIRQLNAITYDNTVITVPGAAYKVLKKIGNAKSENEIEIYVSNVDEDKEKAGNICFKGADYVYITNLLYGDYLNVDSIISEVTDFQFTMSSKELEKIAKEYYKVSKSTELPMYFTKYNEKLSTAIILTDYQTADIFESTVGTEKIPDNFMVCISPKFIAEAAGIFDGSDITVRMRERLSRDESYYLSGMWLENEDFKCIILPKSGSVRIAENIRKIISKI